MTFFLICIYGIYFTVERRGTKRTPRAMAPFLHAPQLNPGARDAFFAPFFQRNPSRAVSCKRTQKEGEGN